MNNRQSGSVLWFILLAIALLAALAIAITRSSNTAEQNGGIEHNRIIASQIMREAAGIEAAIDQMRLRSVSESDIDFDTTALPGYVNTGCTVDDCKVFATGGGGQTYDLPAGANDGSPWRFTGTLDIAGSGQTGTPELTMLLPGLSQSLCQQIDNGVGVATIPNVGVDVTALGKFTGSYGSSTAVTAVDKHAACFADINGVYTFYQVLIAR